MVVTRPDSSIIDCHDQRGRPVTMIRPDLMGIQDFPILPSYSIRPFREGDDVHWFIIQRAADRYNLITGKSFQDTFGNDRKELEHRQYYLVNADNRIIGTGTAWYGSNPFSASWGRIHWVAIIPEYQGQGLAKPLMSTLCDRLLQLGHEKAYLKTLDIRLNAVKLYQRFGFEPLIESVEDRVVWNRIFDQLDNDYDRS